MERPHRNKIVFSAARNPEAFIGALAAFCLICFSAPSVGLSPDSISYTSVARSLCSTGSPIEFDGEWMMDFPLGYPALLSLIIFITRLDPFQFGLLLNALLFGCLVFICLQETKRNGFPLFLRIGYGLGLLFSTALLQVYGMLWSETLFILCIALFFLACGRYGSTHRTRALCGMAGATALACVTRYIGVTLLGMGLLLLLADRTMPRRKRLSHLFLYGAGSSSLLLVNLVVNRVNGGNMAGDRLINHTPAAEHIERFGTTLIRWLSIPPDSPAGFSTSPSPALAMVCALLFVGGSILGLFYLYRRKRSLYSWAGLGLLFTSVYSLFILALAILTAFQPLDSRLLSPLWFPALGAAAGGILALTRRQYGKILILADVLAAVIILIIPGLVREYRYLRDPERVYRDNIRYDFRPYGKSPTLQFINDHPGLFHSDKPIYSNAGEVLYVLGSLQSDYLPRLDLPAEIQAFNADSPYLVWLHAVHEYPSAYLSDLKKVSSLAPLYSFPDGIIYSAQPVQEKQ